MTTPLPPQPRLPPCPPGSTMNDAGACIPNEYDGPPQPEPYLNASEGLSGIGRAMRDKYMANQENMMRRMPRPPDEVYKKGGKVKKYKGGGSVSSASKRADGIAQRGKTRGRFV